MIAEDIRIVDLDEAHWRRLLGLSFDGLGHRTHRPILLVVADGDRVLKAIHSKKGTLKGYATVLTSNLEALAVREKVDAVWVLDRSALPELFRRADARWDPRRAYFDTLFDVARGFTEIYETRIRRWPPLALPAVPPERVGQAVEWAIPDDRTYVFYVFEDPRTPWTSCILRKTAGEFDLLTTHETLAKDGFEIRDWRADAPRILQAIEAKWGSPFAGVFLEREALERVLRAERPVQALMDSAHTGEALISPYPVRLKVLLGVLRWVT